jgi:hypothetical protein
MALWVGWDNKWCELLPSLVVSPYPKGHVSYCHHLLSRRTHRAMWTIATTCCLTLPKGSCELLPSFVVSPYPKGHVSYCHHLLSHHTQRAMWAIAILLSHPTQRVMWTIAITCCLTVPKGPWELLPSLVVTPYPKDHVNYCQTTSDGNSSHDPLGRVRQQMMAIVHMALWVGWDNKWWQ